MWELRLSNMQHFMDEGPAAPLSVSIEKDDGSFEIFVVFIVDGEPVATWHHRVINHYDGGFGETISPEKFVQAAICGSRLHSSIVLKY